jgi:hypothetical protein
VIRHTLTARHDGAWRWVALNTPNRINRNDLIAEAERVIEAKLAEARENLALVKENGEEGVIADCEEAVSLWEKGGITLTRDGKLLWSRPAA